MTINITEAWFKNEFGQMKYLKSCKCHPNNGNKKIISYF